MKEVEILIEKYKVLDLIPIKEFTEALKIDFRETENLKVGFYPMDSYPRKYALFVKQAFIIVKTIEPVERLQFTNGLVICVLLTQHGHFLCDWYSSFDSHHVWSTNYWTKQEEFMLVLKKSQEFINKTKIENKSSDRVNINNPFGGAMSNFILV